MTANQTIITGLNQRATVAVPRDWKRKRAKSRMAETAMTRCGPAMWRSSGTSCMPWKAPRTEIAGVITASP